MKLTSLIKKIRNSRTQNEERTIVLKECAAIRDELGSRETKNRAKNVAKLIYIHTLGYPTHFGRIDSITLMSSSVFAVTTNRICFQTISVIMLHNCKLLMAIWVIH